MNNLTPGYTCNDYLYELVLARCVTLTFHLRALKQ